ncbi:hypothetical protein [Actinospica sp.]|uniref:hypothetical protein n=1 Tax=Actinospica sp. TaxID=1872142 RepID=UPI002CF638E3|nr:hypothetical protein [Actinospica sp.]HWG28406.1 hypothetical protein [Actinospica sp.]
MAPRIAANPATITPDLAMVLHDAKPHPQLGSPAPRPPSTAQLGNAAAAIAAGLALPPGADAAEQTDADLAGLRASYLLPPGTRARVHRTGPSGVLLLAPSAAPRAVAMAAPGVYVVVEVAG